MGDSRPGALRAATGGLFRASARDGHTGGALPSDHKEIKNASITMPAALTKTRAVFAGWTASVAPVGPHAVGATYAVTANVTLKATWAEIASVTVTPGTRGANNSGQQFSAAVTATLGVTPPQGVTWSIVETHHAGTGIDVDGLLTIASAETAETLTIRATSTVDDTKYGDATFTMGDTSFVVNPGSGGNPIW